MIIDAHTHISKITGTKFAESFEKDKQYLLDELRDNKIDLALVLAGFTKDESFNVNSSTLAKMVAGSDKLKAVGSIDVLNYTQDDLAELEGLLKNGDIVGVKLYTGYQHFYPADPKCLPIYELCVKYGRPVIFHSGDTLPGYIVDPKVKYSHPLQIDEVAADLPSLKIVIAHMGNPWLIDCAELLYKNPNVYADISGLVVGENLETPYGKLMRGRILELMAYTEGNDKLIYATDWPLCPMKTYLKFVDNLGLSSDRLDRLMYKNAKEVFGLQQSDGVI